MSNIESRQLVSAARLLFMQSGGFNRGMRSLNLSLLSLTLLIAGFLSASANLAAQVRFGTVVGNVTDINGASLIGATAKLTNLGTNEVRETQSSSAGTYTFNNLQPGQYRLEMDQNGFKRFVANSVQVSVDVTTRIDVALQVGTASETVEVQSESVSLQTDSTTLGSVVTQQTVENLPVSGRNANNIMTLVPGVNAGGSTYGTASGNQAGGARTNSIAFGNYFIGGAFGNQSAFFVDGVPSNGPANNANGALLSQDFIQEFRVATNNVSAEYGNYAGGVINQTTKSGTNTFHGNGYDYLRNKVLNSNNFFGKRAGSPRPQLIQNQFGGNGGGPIWKNKMFFFFGYEGTRSISAVLGQSNMPTAAALSGDFSDPAFPAIYDHTQILGHDSNNQPIYAQFSCNGKLNVICPGRIDPSAKAILADTYPKNLPTVIGTSAKPNNFIQYYPTGGTQNLWDARVDQNFGAKDQMFARYLYSKVISNPYDAWGTHTSGQGPTGVTSQQAVLGNTYTINPSMLVDFRLFYVRIFQTEAPDSTGINYSKYGGSWASFQGQLVGGPTHGGGSIPSTSYTSTGGAPATAFTNTNGVGSQLYWMQNVSGLSGNLIKTLGRHQIKFGANFRHVQWIAEKNTQGITMTYNNEPTASAQANSTTGIALASDLLGIPQISTVGNVGESVAFYNNYGFFVEDTYQATRRLTATLGVRWDQPNVYSEAHNKDTVFLPNSTTTIGNVTSYVNPVTGQSQQAKGLLALVASQPWPSQREDNLHWKLFAPRAGLAYRMDDKTVIRAGYGLSFLPISLSQDGPSFSPINTISTQIKNTFQVTTGNADQVFATTTNPFPNGVNQPPGRSANLASYYGSTVVSRVPGDKAAYQQQWNLAIERQIGNNGTLTVAYAGSKGTHLLLQGFATASNININQVPTGYLNLGTAALNAQVPNPFYGQITNSASPMSKPTINAGYLMKPFPQYDRVLSVDPHRGFSSYNSLQVSVNKRIWAGGTVIGAYTWSKLMANTDAVTNFLDPGFIFGGTIQDNTNVTKAERSISEYDLPQNLTFGYLMPLPFGKGRAYLKNANAVLNGIVGGWNLNGLTSIRSGPPLGLVQPESSTLQTYGAGNGFIFAPGVFIRPDAVAGCNKKTSGSRFDRLSNWYNVGCFAPTFINNPTHFGTEPRVDSGIRIDGTKNWDLGLSKETAIHENLTVRFTAQAYNVFNRTQFSGPSAVIAPGAASTVTATSAPPRNIEFALRVSF